MNAKSLRGILILVWWLSYVPSFGQCTQWESLMAMPDVEPEAVAFDRLGNRYVGGFFDAPTLTLGAVSLSLSGTSAGFLIKFDSEQNAVWGKAFGVDGSDAVTKIIVNCNNDVIIAGRLTSTSLTFGTTTLNRSGTGGLFLAMVSGDGQFLWAKQSIGGDLPLVTDLKIGSADEILVAGNFVFPITIAGTAVPWFSGYDMFVLSMSNQGNVNWVRSFGQAGSAMPDYVTGIEVDHDGNILMTGFFESPALSFGGFTLNANAVSENYFIVKLSSSGAVLWAHGTQGPANVGGFTVAINSANEVYVTGRYQNTAVNFDGLIASNQGEADIFVAKYDANGQILALKTFGGSGFDSGLQLGINQLDEVLLGAFFYSNSLTVGGFTMTKPEFQSDAFVVKFNPSLSAICLSQISGTSEAYIDDLVIDTGGDVWVVAENGLNFGDTRFGSSFTVTNPDIQNMLARLKEGTGPGPGPGPIESFSLGPDLFICPTQAAVVTGPFVCGGAYLWSTGATSLAIEISEPGLYWLEISDLSGSARDTVLVSAEGIGSFSLGPDVVKCPNEIVGALGPIVCGATYRWSTGAASTAINITTPGWYWLEISTASESVTDSLLVTDIPDLQVDLGPDQTLCPGATLSIEITVEPGVSYIWNDGLTTPTRVINEPGVYWLKLEDGCGIFKDTVKLDRPVKIAFGLEDDIVLCSYSTLKVDLQDGVDYVWNDGTTGPEIPVTHSGSYTLTATTACEVVSDQTTVTLIDVDPAIVPNVVTPNGDQKNDLFVLPLGLGTAAVTIINRWGGEVFSAAAYSNSWPSESVSTGVYYYYIKAQCASEPIRGSITVIR